MSFGQMPTVTFDPSSQSLNEASLDAVVISSTGKGKTIDPLKPPYDESQKLLGTDEARKFLDTVQKLSRSKQKNPPKPNRAQRRKEQG